MGADLVEPVGQHILSVNRRRPTAVILSNPAVQRSLTATIVVMLLICRRPKSFFTPRLWAEDGAVFYVTALTQGAARTIFEPYAGYFQVVGRLASILCAHIPAIAVPAVYAVIAYAISAWACSLFIERRFENVVISPTVRFFVCCLLAGSPPADELIATITNSHWYLSLGALLLLIGRPITGRQNIVRNACSAGLLLLASLSGAESVFLVPLAMWRVATTKDRVARLVPVALLVGVAAELLPLQGAGRGLRYTPSDTIISTIGAFTHRVVISAIFGQNLSIYFSAQSMAGFVLTICLVFTVLIVIGMMHVRDMRLPLAAFLVFSLFSIGTALYSRGLMPLYPNLEVISYGGARYFFIPISCFIVVAGMVADRVAWFGLPGKCLCLAIMLGAGCISNFQLGIADVGWPEYAPQIDRWIAAQRSLRPTPAVTVPVNPPGFTFTLPARL